VDALTELTHMLERADDDAGGGAEGAGDLLEDDFVVSAAMRVRMPSRQFALNPNLYGGTGSSRKCRAGNPQCLRSLTPCLLARHACAGCPSGHGAARG
jgi:hypothetical protein